MDHIEEMLKEFYQRFKLAEQDKLEALESYQKMLDSFLKYKKENKFYKEWAIAVSSCVLSILMIFNGHRIAKMEAEKTFCDSDLEVYDSVDKKITREDIGYVEALDDFTKTSLVEYAPWHKRFWLLGDYVRDVTTYEVDETFEELIEMDLDKPKKVGYKRLEESKSVPEFYDEAIWQVERIIQEEGDSFTSFDKLEYVEEILGISFLSLFCMWVCSGMIENFTHIDLLCNSYLQLYKDYRYRKYSLEEIRRMLIVYQGYARDEEMFRSFFIDIYKTNAGRLNSEEIDEQFRELMRERKK